MATNDCLYSAITDVRYIKSGSQIYVGDGPDARTCRFLLNTVVRHNWPSQGRPRHLRGYILLVNDAGTYVRYDIMKRTINYKEVFLFCASQEVVLLFERQNLVDAIMTSMASDADFIAAAKFTKSLVDTANQLWALSRTSAIRAIEACLPALSNRDLKEILRLLSNDDLGPDGLAVAGEVP